MNKRQIFLILILILAFLLRYWKIADFPKTLYGDEQAFAWNAYNILKTGYDEYGTSYPLQFRSFDDYKAPIPVYLLVPVFKFFGMNAWSIRMPLSLASFLTVVVFYFFCRLFLNPKVSLLAVFLFAVSPWHVHLSRGYFEATLALLFFLSAIYFFFASRFRIKQLILSAFLFNLSLYSYFTPRMLLPLFIPYMLVLAPKFSNQLKKENYLKPLAIFVFVFFLLSVPLIRLTFFDKGLSRFNKLNETVSTSIANTVNIERTGSNLPLNIRSLFHNKAVVWLRLVKNNYLEHLSINFWYIYGDNSLRYFLGNMGMFYLFEMPFLFLGIIYLFKNNRPLAYFLLGWILLAPVPASIVGRSFAVRSLAMLPAPFIFVAAGIYSSVRNRLHYVFLTLIVIFFFGHVLIRYYLEYPVYAATWWGWENKTAIDFAQKREDFYNNIFISDYYTGAPLAFAVYNQYDPQQFRQALNNPVVLADNRRFIKLGKYYFGSLDLDKQRQDQKLIPPKSLYIGRPEEAPSKVTINAPDDGRLIFNIYATD